MKVRLIRNLVTGNMIDAGKKKNKVRSIFKVLKQDFVQIGRKPSRGFGVVFANFVEMFFGFVFGFASYFLNFAMHDKEKKEKERKVNFRQ